MKKEHKKVYFNSFLDYTHGRRGREPPPMEIIITS
jgi:hypothetical protein